MGDIATTRTTQRTRYSTPTSGADLFRWTALGVFVAVVAVLLARGMARALSATLFDPTVSPNPFDVVSIVPFIVVAALVFAFMLVPLLTVAPTQGVTGAGRPVRLPRGHGRLARRVRRRRGPALNPGRESRDRRLRTGRANRKFEAADAAGTPPWDVGRPQGAMVGAIEDGAVEGRVLDAGCGTGGLSLFLAENGHEVVGVDASPTAVERAREKAQRRGLDVEFRVGDLLDRPDLEPFDTGVDSGVLHVFSDEDRARHLASLAGVLRPGRRPRAVAPATREPASVVATGEGRFGAVRVR